MGINIYILMVAIFIFIVTRHEIIFIITQGFVA